MQIWFFCSLWLILSLVGRVLLVFRSDYTRILRDWKTIKNKRVFGIVLLILLMAFFLPFSIPYSIANIKNKHQNK